MAGVGEAMNPGGGKSALPLVEETIIEDEILGAPTDQHRRLAKTVQPFLDFTDQGIRPVAGTERNVLNEAKHGDAILPGIVRPQILFADNGGHRPARTAPSDDRSAKSVGAANDQRTEQLVPTDPKLPGKALRRR